MLLLALAATAANVDAANTYPTRKTDAKATLDAAVTALKAAKAATPKDQAAIDAAKKVATAAYNANESVASDLCVAQAALDAANAVKPAVVQADVDAAKAGVDAAWKDASLLNKAGFYQRTKLQRGVAVSAAFAALVASIATYHKVVNKSTSVLKDTGKTLLTPVTKIGSWAKQGGAANYAKIAGTVSVLAVAADLVAGYIVDGGYKGYGMKKIASLVRGY